MPIEKIPGTVFRNITSSSKMPNGSFSLFRRGTAKGKPLYLTGMHNRNPESGKLIRGFCAAVFNSDGELYMPGYWEIERIIIRTSKDAKRAYSWAKKMILDFQKPGARVPKDEYRNIFSFENPDKFEGPLSSITVPSNRIDVFNVSREEKKTWHSSGSSDSPVTKVGSWVRNAKGGFEFIPAPVIDYSGDQPVEIEITEEIFTKKIMEGEIIVAFDPKSRRVYEFMIEKNNRWFWQCNVPKGGIMITIENKNPKQQMQILAKEAIRDPENFGLKLSEEERDKIIGEIQKLSKGRDGPQAGETTPHILLGWFRATDKSKKPEVAFLISNYLQRDQETVQMILDIAEKNVIDSGDDQVDKILNRMINRFARKNASQGKDFIEQLKIAMLNEQGYTWYRLVQHFHGELELLD